MALPQYQMRDYSGTDPLKPGLCQRRSFGRQEHSRLRFLSNQDALQSDDGWVSGEKLDLKLADFLHYASSPADDATASTTAETEKGRKKKKPSFNVIACHSDNESGMLSITEQQNAQVESIGKLPLSKLALFEQNGQYASHVEYEGDAPSALCILFQSPRSFIHDVSCCMRISILDQSVLAVYFDRNENRIASILEESREFLEHPVSGAFKFISLVLEAYSVATEQWRRVIDKRVRLTESETGARSRNIEFEPDKIAEYNFGQLNINMQSSNASLVYLEHVLGWQYLTWEFTVEMLVLHGQLCRQAHSTYLPIAMEDQLSRTIRNNMNACKLRQSRVDGAQKRLQNQIGMLFNLISQRDNRLTIQLADDSRTIAMAAKNDSKVMKFIAVLGLVFLPPGLIATIFSSGIFVLSDVPAGTSRVSSLWWIYVLVSVLSTGLTLLASVCFLRFSEARASLSKKRAGKQS